MYIIFFTACGCDGQWYGNACLANQKLISTSIQYIERCKQDPEDEGDAAVLSATPSTVALLVSLVMMLSMLFLQ